MTYPGKAQSYLNTLCGLDPHRRTGSAGNRAATDYVARMIRGWGYEVDTTPFPCIDYESGPVTLEEAENRYEVLASPFSPGVQVSAVLATVSTVPALEKCDCRGLVLLLRGEIAAEPLMPKSFVFYNPDHHRRIYALLEEKRPAAIITASPRSEMAGAMYPFPMIEDGDFDIPSVYCSDATGDAIASISGQTVQLGFSARRIPSTGTNVIATKDGSSGKRVVVCAHVDAKPETPGATDDASGITVLLLLAEMLADHTGNLGIEIAAINGEDYYGAPGEMDYLRRYGASMARIALATNIDGAGYKDGKTSFSLYECPDQLQQRVRSVFARHRGIVEGGQWYQGDHMLFVQGGRPSLAITSEKAMELLTTITHTPKDTPDRVDCGKLVEIARALSELIREL